MFFFLVVSIGAQVTPIVDVGSGSLLGGVEKGQWVNAERAFKARTENEAFKLYVPGADAENFPLKLRPTGIPCEDQFSFDSEVSRDRGVAVGASATWNLTPRPITALANSDATYLAVVRTVLRGQGFVRSKPIIEQAYRVDLDGDGTDEVVLTASSFGPNMTPSAKAGDYSFVLLRKIVNGRVRNLLVGKEFIRKNIEFGAPGRFDIAGILDLNGDGKMEIVMGDAYYEGAGASVYEVTKTGFAAVKLLQAGCGV
jgi:hypothetical protein